MVEIQCFVKGCTAISKVKVFCPVGNTSYAICDWHIDKAIKIIRHYKKTCLELEEQSIDEMRLLK